MTTSLRTQLAAYGDQHDAGQPPITMADILEQVEAVRPIPYVEPQRLSSPGRPRRLVVAVAIAAVVLLVGLPLLLLRLVGSTDPDPATPTTVTTTTLIETPARTIQGFEFSAGPEASGFLVGVWGNTTVDISPYDFPDRIPGVVDVWVGDEGPERRRLPEPSEGLEITMDLLEGAIWVTASDSHLGSVYPETVVERWVSFDFGETWQEWTWEQPDGLDGVLLDPPAIPYIDLMARLGNDLAAFSRDFGSLMVYLEPDPAAVADRFGAGVATKRYRGEFSVWIDGEKVGVIETKTVRSPEGIDVEYFALGPDAAGEPELFHVGHVEMPAGLDTTNYALDDYSDVNRWVESTGWTDLLPGFWILRDGTTFEWRWITEIAPFEAPHFEVEGSDEFTVVASTWRSQLPRTPPFTTSVWRLDQDELREVAFIDGFGLLTGTTPFGSYGEDALAVNGSRTALLLWEGTTDADPTTLFLSQADAANFEAVREFEPSFISAFDARGGAHATFEAVSITDTNIIVSGSRATTVWVGSLSGDEWFEVDLPDRSLPGPPIYVGEDGTLVYNAGDGWQIGAPIFGPAQTPSR